MLALMFASLLMGIALTTNPSDKVTSQLSPVPFTQVRLQDKFWAPRQATLRKNTMPHALDQLEKPGGGLKNFDRAARIIHNLPGDREGFDGYVFQDSDSYKMLEAIAYSLADHPDAAMEKRVDGIIARIGAAQMADGYLNTYYTVKEPGRRLTNLRDNHELYCAGHLFEAAAAHYQATGKRNFLDIATKYADFLVATFGEGKRAGYCGHPESELALVKLWRVTKKPEYLELARFLVSHRGEHFFAQEHKTPEKDFDGTYWLDDVPIRNHRAIKGHAVRAAYLMSGATDVAALTNDAPLLKMLDRVWANTEYKNTFVTGGIGPSGSNEGFTTDYDLPTYSAYQETCASVALAQWNWRMNQLHGDAKYADSFERSLYNGALAGISLDGDRFFYVNPLASHGDHHRQAWFGCACCPPNISRTIASIGDYIYAQAPGTLVVNLYVASEVKASGQNWRVETNFPWAGSVKLTRLDAGGDGTLRLRVPGWAPNASFAVNGNATASSPKNGYQNLTRRWKKGDVVTVNCPMPVRRIVANPLAKDLVGRAAFARGPLVYAFEQVDQKADLQSVSVPLDQPFTAVSTPILGGIMQIEGMGVPGGGRWSGGLYQSETPGAKVRLVGVPYYAWDNRKAGEMQVWLPVSPEIKPVLGPESSAKFTMSHVSGNCQPAAINDGIEPKSSGEQPATLTHFWPRKGGSEWMQYEWKQPRTLASTQIYWFDDTGRGECRMPVSYRVLYRDGNKWVPIPADFPVLKDQWTKISFAPIKTTALRLAINQQAGWASGVHEWKVGDWED